MKALDDLASRWEQEAKTLDRYHDERGAAAARLHAGELREAVRVHSDELLSPPVASSECGYSKRRLRELEAEGLLANHGRKGAPRYRRSELPKKAKAAPPAFDAAGEVRALLA